VTLSLKHIIVSILFVLFSIYVAFLNPHESTFHLTQSQTFKLPTVILLLAAVFTGVVISVGIFWAFSLKNAFSRWKKDLQNNRVKKKYKRFGSYFKKAENLFLCGRIDKASAILDKILYDNPNHVKALNLKGKILCAEGKNSQGVTLQKKALGKEPENISLLFDLATTYAETNHTDEEIKLLRKIQCGNPDVAQPLFHLREAYLKKKDWKNILINQDKILSLIRDNKKEWDEEIRNKSRFLYARGKQKWEEEKRDLAISDFKQALKVWNKNSDAQLLLGEAYLETGKPKLAIKNWIAGFKQTQNTCFLIRAQKVIYVEGENPKDLIQIYLKNIELNQQQESYKYLLLLAILYLEHEQAENAKSILEEIEKNHELLGSLLLTHARNPSIKGSNFDLIKEAIFAL
jgi:tetratricopeptide (TPR) repeat protein